MRELTTLEMIEVDVQGLPPNSQFTVYLANDTFRIPAATVATHPNGVGNALAFVKFFGTFTQVVVAP